VFGVEFQALALDPRDPTIVYAGAGLTGDGGTYSGLFKSTDAGLTFEAADLGIERTVVSSIAVDPFDSRTVYAASPQPSNLVSTPQPNGILKSTDGGATWQVKNHGRRLPAAKDERFGLQTGVIQVAVDPETAGTLYAVVGSSGELYRSRDGAESWQLLPTSFAAATLVVGRHGVLYLGGALPGQPPTVWKSLDGGRHWRRTAAPSFAALLAPPSEPAAGRGGVASDDVLFAASGGGLARSTDGGASWQVSDAGLSILAIDHSWWSRPCCAPGSTSTCRGPPASRPYRRRSSPFRSRATATSSSIRPRCPGSSWRRDSRRATTRRLAARSSSTEIGCCRTRSSHRSSRWSEMPASSEWAWPPRSASRTERRAPSLGAACSSLGSEVLRSGLDLLDCLLLLSGP
jgi:hypothetical protein